MWGIASGDGLHVATGTHGAVVISRKDGPWTGRVLDGKPLLMATTIANGRDIFIAGSTGGFVNGKALPHLQSSLDEDAMPVPTSLRGRC